MLKNNGHDIIRLSYRRQKQVFVWFQRSDRPGDPAKQTDACICIAEIATSKRGCLVSYVRHHMFLTLAVTRLAQSRVPEPAATGRRRVHLVEPRVLDSKDGAPHTRG